jgi:rhodanese-related sulfurtransferase
MSQPLTVADLLTRAREQLDRFDVARTKAAVEHGWGIVDIRPAWQRANEGEIEGSLIVERNHLEWRLDRRSGAHVPEAEQFSKWVVVCSEGYTSSLAAASLCSIGIEATDLIDGIQAWRQGGGPLVSGVTPADSVVGSWAPTDGLVGLGAPLASQRRGH